MAPPGDRAPARVFATSLRANRRQTSSRPGNARGGTEVKERCALTLAEWQAYASRRDAPVNPEGNLSSTATANLTGLLRAWSAGDADAGEQLIPLVYQELRRQASRYL